MMSFPLRILTWLLFWAILVPVAVIGVTLRLIFRLVLPGAKQRFERLEEFRWSLRVALNPPAPSLWRNNVTPATNTKSKSRAASTGLRD